MGAKLTTEASRSTLSFKAALPQSGPEQRERTRQGAVDTSGDASRLPGSAVCAAHQDEVRVHQCLDASLLTVWEACASARGLARWQADRVQGRVRAGEKITLRWPMLNARAELEVLEADPHRLLRWRHLGSEVVMTFEPSGLTLTQTQVPAEHREALASSWRISLAQLAHCTARHPGRDRRVYWATRAMPCSAQAAYLCFLDGSLIGQWLGQTASVNEDGRFSLASSTGERFEGHVLVAVEGRDVALCIDSAAESTLVMRTLPNPLAPGERIVALCYSEWGAPQAAARAWVAEFDRALLDLEKLLAPSALH
jgi:uncharacterized protein YndB with AHSA1/START domain